jgi:REP element-mobilizing transposase RayT
MNDKLKYDPNIHHRKSIRLKGYDYSQAGLYFITICCQDRVCRFGKIVDVADIRAKKFLPQQKMILNDAGNIANECWLEIPNHFPNSILHEHIVMPNHVHGIIELTGTVGVQNFESQQRNEFQKIIPLSIGSIIRGFKIGVTKWFRSNTDIETVWQRNFYEHIIRNEQSYHTISHYIINNPAKWNNDKFYSEQQL